MDQEKGIRGQGRQAGQAGQARRREAQAEALQVAVARELPERVDNLKQHLHDTTHVSLNFPHLPATLASSALTEPEEHWQTSEQDASQELAT